MGGIELVKQSFKSVFDNLNSALAISGLLWIGVIALQVALGGAVLVDAEQANMSNHVGSLLLVSLATAVVSLWVAVAWHRFMLLEEVPRSLLPPFHGARVGAYLMMSIIVGLVGGIVFILLSFVVAPLLALVSATGGTQMMGFGLIILISYAFYRVSPVFPAAAIGEGEGLGTAWRRTKPLSSDLWGAAIIFSLVGMAIQMPSILLGSGLVGVIYSLLSGWVMLMVGVSLITTIYMRTEKAQA